MIIGRTRIGDATRIGRRWMFSEGVTTNAQLFSRLVASLTTQANLAQQTLLSLPTNAQLVSYVFPELTTNAEIIGNYIIWLTTSASLTGYAYKEVTTNANLAAQTLASLTSNAYLAAQTLASLTSNATLIERLLVSLTTNGQLATQTLKSLTTNGQLATQETTSLTTQAQLLEFILKDLTTDADLATQTTTSVTTNALLLSYYYWYLGSQNLQGMIYDLQPSGFGLKSSEQRLKTRRRVDLFDEGIEGGQYSFHVGFSSETSKSSFLEAINNDSEDTTFYRGRSDRYHRVKRVAVEPGVDEPYRRAWSSKVRLLLEDPYLYSANPQTYNPGVSSLPATTPTAFSDIGTASGLVTFTIGGAYNAGQLTSAYVKLMNGATAERSLYLGAQILSNENVALTEDGHQRFYLDHTYSDDFSVATNWTRDATQYGCTLSGGAISVPAGAYFYYRFRGNPLKENIALLATITVSSGSPLIQMSTDGSNWTTAVATTEISSGVQKTYYITGSEKLSDVYVRFYSGSGAAMSVGDVAFSMQRDISAYHDQLPEIGPGESRTIQVTGSGSTRARVNLTFRSRWHP